MLALVELTNLTFIDFLLTLTWPKGDSCHILYEAIFRTWIENPVMVNKYDGTECMYIYYSDLNKACPKDCYPLPEINQKGGVLTKVHTEMFSRSIQGAPPNIDE